MNDNLGGFKTFYKQTRVSRFLVTEVQYVYRDSKGDVLSLGNGTKSAIPDIMARCLRH